MRFLPLLYCVIIVACMVDAGDAIQLDDELHADCPPAAICQDESNIVGGPLTLKHTTRSVDPSELQEILSPCGEFEYDVDLILLQHFYLYLQPVSDEAKEMGCPTALIHSSSLTLSPDSPLKKNFLFVFDDFANLESLGFMGKDGTLIDYGKFTLRNIAGAYLRAEVNAPGHKGQAYNFAMNNCADLIGNVLHELGYVMTATDSRMIASGLLKVFPLIASKVRSSLQATDPHHILHSMSDEDIAFWIVEARTTKMYEAKQQAAVKSLRSDVDALQEEVAELNLEVAALKEGQDSALGPKEKRMFGPPETSDIHNYDEAVAFCQSKHLALGSYQDYCGDSGTVYGGAKDSHEWAPTSDHKNAWVFVGASTKENLWKECTTHEEADNGKSPTWGIDKTAKESFEANYVLCTGSL